MAFHVVGKGDKVTPALDALHRAVEDADATADRLKASARRVMEATLAERMEPHPAQVRAHIAAEALELLQGRLIGLLVLLETHPESDVGTLLRSVLRELEDALVRGRDA